MLKQATLSLKASELQLLISSSNDFEIPLDSLNFASFRSICISFVIVSKGLVEIRQPHSFHEKVCLWRG